MLTQSNLVLLLALIASDVEAADPAADAPAPTAPKDVLGGYRVGDVFKPGGFNCRFELDGLTTCYLEDRTVVVAGETLDLTVDVCNGRIHGVDAYVRIVSTGGSRSRGGREVARPYPEARETAFALRLPDEGWSEIRAYAVDIGDNLVVLAHPDGRRRRLQTYVWPPDEHGSYWIFVGLRTIPVGPCT